MWFSEILRVSQIYTILKTLVAFFTFQTPERLTNMNCLMSSAFSVMSSKNFLCKMNPISEISQISIFAERKISTMKISML